MQMIKRISEVDSRGIYWICSGRLPCSRSSKLTYEDVNAVHEINKDGYFATSHADLDLGTVTDQYFYIDETW